MNLGLLARLVHHDVFWAEVSAFAGRLAARSQLSIHAMKEIVDAIASGDDDIPEVNSYWQQQMDLSGDPEIGVRAFLAKEVPAFTWNGMHVSRPR
jgi:hypothetical protein